MAFEDLQALTWAGVVTGPGSEKLPYTSVGDDGEAAPVNIDAHVHQSGLDDPVVIPQSGRVTLLPIFVTCLKSAVPNLRVKWDRVTWRGNEYVIKEVVEDDGVSLELYCAR